MMVIVKPIRATRGITIFRWRKMARRGRETKTEPKPERDCVKPAKKVIRQINKYVCI
jgi:hypothetical protein